jgi:hypothetical protein
MGILLVRVAKGVGMLEADGFNIIDLDPDATSSQFASEASFKLSLFPSVSRTPSPPPARVPNIKPSRSTAQVTDLTSSPPLPSTGNTSNGRKRRNPRPPENESTPPSSTRKPSYMTYRPLASPPKPTQIQPTDISICSCAFGEDLTASTVHCHCEIHGSDDGRSDPDTSVDESHLNWRNQGNLPINILAVSSSLNLSSLLSDIYRAPEPKPRQRNTPPFTFSSSLLRNVFCVAYSGCGNSRRVRSALPL